jgi:cytochrome c oxidase cbb3-type subunit IV
MDLNDVRAAVTVASFIAFLGLVAWAWSRSRRDGFDQAARLPFDDEAPQAAPQRSTGAQQ